MDNIPEVLALADTFRSIVNDLDIKIDPFEALADHVVNEREAQVERSGAVPGDH